MGAKFDIFRRLPDGHPVWMKAVKGLDEAKCELAQIAKLSPGEYFIYDTRNGNVISTDRTAHVSPAPELGATLSD